jgi:hypothetical protein
MDDSTQMFVSLFGILYYILCSCYVIGLNKQTQGFRIFGLCCVSRLKIDYRCRLDRVADYSDEMPVADDRKFAVSLILALC